MKFKRTVLSLIGASTLAMPIAAISCKVKVKILTKLRMEFKTPWAEFNSKEFSRVFTREFNKQLRMIDVHHLHVDIEVVADTTDNDLIVSNVASGKFQFGISSFGAINNFSNQDEFERVLQTTTNSFIFDKNWSTYKNGLQNDPLIQVAKGETLALNEYISGHDIFNGNIYPAFYDPSKQVDFYRGSIYIVGSQSQLSGIKNAWEQKDWNAFRNFGIITGGETSESKFKLQEQLFKEHFGKDAFTTLAEDKLNHQDKYTVGKVRDIGKDSNYNIAFAAEGSFSWTEKKPGYFVPKQGESIEVLSVTNPIQYDIGILSDEIAGDLGKVFLNTFIALANNSQDTYGSKNGYNGYEKYVYPSENLNSIYSKEVNA